MLKRGSTGQKVIQLQKDLNSLGYLTKVDGDFGPNTEKQLRKFQKNNGLVVDGVYGAISHARMLYVVDREPINPKKIKAAPNVIKKVAESFLGYREIPGNLGFVDDDFQSIMGKTGWKEKQAWCVFFCEAVYRRALGELLLEDDLANQVGKLFDVGAGGAVNTWNVFLDDERFVCDQTPSIGSMAIWQTYNKGKAHWTGHAAIVTDFGDDFVITIDGNTNDNGSREGVMVAKKQRAIAFTPDYSRKHLVLKGFVHII